MRSITNFLTFFIFLFCTVYPIKVSSQDAEPASEITTAKSPMQEARSLMSKNKNAEALDVLQKHGSKIVPAYKKSQDSIVNSLTARFTGDQKEMTRQISSKQTEVNELKSGNAGISQENTILTTNTIVFFSILIGVVVFILLSRFSSLAKAKQKLKNAGAMLAEMEKSTLSFAEYKTQLLELAKPVENVQAHITNDAPWLSSALTDKTHKYHKPAQQLVSSTNSVMQLIQGQLNPIEDDLKVETDLNALIEEAINQAYFAMVKKHPEFKCTIVKDLEKILPKKEVYPEEIRFVLFNLLENALDAVWKKRRNSPKGYEPTVTVSSRKLPRFIQIRVKDNGIGISEAASKKVFEPFYSERQAEFHPGLGLSESYRIITERHKGELFIESDLTNSTDFIIRFPTLALM